VEIEIPSISLKTPSLSGMSQGGLEGLSFFRYKFEFLRLGKKKFDILCLPSLRLSLLITHQIAHQSSSAFKIT
jgi:hypothetical protein